MIIQPIAIDWQNATENLLTTGTITGLSLKATGLTPTHVVYAGTAGLLSGSANLVFEEPNLTCAGIVQFQHMRLLAGANADYRSNQWAGATNQLAFENQTAGQTFNWNFMARDGDGTDSIFNIYRGVGTVAGGVTNTETFSVGYFGSVTPANRFVGVFSLAGGTGTVRPIKIYTGSNTSQLVLDTNGNVGIGVASPLYALHVNGSIYTNSNINALGDIGVGGALSVTGLTTATGGISLPAGATIALATSTGTKIGTATNQLLGFYNATPVDQPATVTDAATQDLTGLNTVDQTKLEADLTSVKNAINTVIDRLQELGLIA